MVLRLSIALRGREATRITFWRVKRERDETLGSRLSCCSSQFDEVIDAVFERFDAAVEHRRVGFEADFVDLAREFS